MSEKTESHALLAEGAVYLIAAVTALHRLGVDMRDQTKPYIADVERELGASVPTGWPEA